MKLAVWLLLLINLVVFAYFHLAGAKPKVTLVGNQPVQPEKIQLLSDREIAQLPRKKLEISAPIPESSASPEIISSASAHCYEWGSFAISRVNTVRQILGKLVPDVEITEQNLQKPAFYWVYIPKLESSAAAQKKIEELKTMGVKDSFIMQDTEQKNAISLGVFHEEASADRLLESLKGKGVNSAMKTIRYKDSNQVTLLVRNVKSELAGDMTKLSARFPNSELKQITCQ